MKISYNKENETFKIEDGMALYLLIVRGAFFLFAFLSGLFLWTAYKEGFAMWEYVFFIPFLGSLTMLIHDTLKTSSADFISKNDIKSVSRARHFRTERLALFLKNGKRRFILFQTNEELREIGIVLRQSGLKSTIYG